MSDSPLYDSMRAFIRECVRAETLSLKEILTREAPKVVEGPPGKDGTNGRDGTDGKPGTDGKNGVDGKDGERGADGIATRAELDSIIEQRFAELQVRSFADAYRGVYKPDELYKRSQFVTWGGSLFLALNDSKTKPGESADWQLVVKRGADGKDQGNRR